MAGPAPGWLPAALLPGSLGDPLPRRLPVMSDRRVGVGVRLFCFLLSSSSSSEPLTYQEQSSTLGSSIANNTNFVWTWLVQAIFARCGATNARKETAQYSSDTCALVIIGSMILALPC